MTKPSSSVPANNAEIADQLHSLAIHILRDARAHDPESGLPPSQLSALSVLVFGGPMPLNRLAEAEQVRAPTMHRTVDALTQKGLVTRARDKRDRRIVYVVATRSGTELLDKARALRLTRIQNKLSNLDTTQRHELAVALTLLTDLYQPVSRD